MGNEFQKAFKDCVGENGVVIDKLSMRNSNNRAYVSEGYCLAMCVQWMCGIQTANIPTRKERIEFGQWIYEGGDRMQKVDEYAKMHGLNQVGVCLGRWLSDEFHASRFLSKSDKRYYWIIGVTNTAGDLGHAFLMYRVPTITEGKAAWMLMDPNAGVARFESAESCLLVFKRVLERLYGEFGPYYPFGIWQYVTS